MKEPTNKCFFCEKEQKPTSTIQTCLYCEKQEIAGEACPDGHFICSLCSQKSTWDLIEDYCLQAASANPVEMAETLMKFPGFKMHCPEHHFMVPAVLLASYSKVAKKRKKLESWLKVARNRAEKVPGAFCGTHGSCGAAVGTGIFMSTITSATPLSNIEWDLSNSTVGKSLLQMAQYGGPRCCKRVSYLALNQAAATLRERLSVQLAMPEKIECKFYAKNEEQCLTEKCPFYPVAS